MLARIFVQATTGLSHRSGWGTARHIDAAELLTQDAPGRRAFELVYVGGGHPAGVLTLNQCRKRLQCDTWLFLRDPAPKRPGPRGVGARTHANDHSTALVQLCINNGRG